MIKINFRVLFVIYVLILRLEVKGFSPSILSVHLLHEGYDLLFTVVSVLQLRFSLDMFVGNNLLVNRKIGGEGV